MARESRDWMVVDREIILFTSSWPFPIPRTLSETEIELLRQLAEAEGKEVREDRGVLNRVRDLFG